MAAELEKQLATLQRGDLARQSLEAFGALILVSGRDEAAELANTLATEHLHIACADAEEMLGKIRNAGAVFLGPVQPGGAGRLRGRPVARAAHRRHGPLRQRPVVERFPAVHSVIHFTPEGLNDVADDAIRMAETRRPHGARRERGDAAESRADSRNAQSGDT